MLKKIIIDVIILIGIIGAMYYTHNYKRTGCTIVAKCDGELTIQDKSGFNWYWYAEDDSSWKIYKAMSIGDNVTLDMYDNGTENIIEDDIIKGIK